MADPRLARPSAHQLVRHILDRPQLARAVQALEPRALHRLIDHVGLEDAGDLVALATTAQLQGIFDEDLWRAARPGQEEGFDSGRFGVWLEILLEIGEQFAARKLIELPEDLVMLALERLLLVIDLDALGVEMAARGGEDEVEQLEKALEGALHIEVDGWRIIARRSDGWDALAGVLLAIDVEDHDFLERVLERLAAAAEREVDDGGGLYTLLTESQTLAADATGDREDRRAGAGFIAPTQAAAFLRLARRDGGEGAERDPVTRAYFRELERAPRPARHAAAKSARAAAPLIEILREADVLERARGPRLAAGEDRDEESPLRQALQALPLAEQARRSEELAYLANVLAAGFDAGDRALRPLEAAEVALAVCELGFAALGDMAPADRLFRAGWKALDDPRALVAALRTDQGVGRD